MIRDYDVRQVLVRVAPPVEDNGVQTDRVLVEHWCLLSSSDR